jgi:hypothetical protein
MAVHARRKGWSAVPTAFPCTFGIIDPPAFMAAVTPLLAERAEAAARMTVSTTEAGATFRLNDERPLSALLFGGDTHESRAIPRCGGALGTLLGALFPLPLLWQGYNYV